MPGNVAPFPQFADPRDRIGRPADPRHRIAALTSDSTLLLDPTEIRFAEANRHVVWLIADCGRFRAATRGIDKLEAELSVFGFVRVHRSFLVNPGRIRRVHRQGNGVITLNTDAGHAECIPVSRRCTQIVRRTLGI
ncbi:LytTR family DNA-binding domain-containing protein [Pseudonocardia sp. GCM10023141]|uniref:LytTR family DNA-binding domain-containing protein n=1 Tax=Pseudonocardia sp. GCM10023141 TaxID=3252653 RepID=UPI00360624C9